MCSLSSDCFLLSAGLFSYQLFFTWGTVSVSGKAIFRTGLLLLLCCFSGAGFSIAALPPLSPLHLQVNMFTYKGPFTGPLLHSVTHSFITLTRAVLAKVQCRLSALAREHSHVLRCDVLYIDAANRIAE